MAVQEYIRNRAKKIVRFLDDYDVISILTVGKPTYQKGYEISERFGISC